MEKENKITVTFSGVGLKEEDVFRYVTINKDDESKIIGRAIVWKLFKPDRTFMDRIYYTTENIVELFKNYASVHGWLYKLRQNMNENEDIIDGKTNEKLYNINRKLI